MEESTAKLPESPRLSISEIHGALIGALKGPAFVAGQLLQAKEAEEISSEAYFYAVSHLAMRHVERVRRQDPAHQRIQTELAALQDRPGVTLTPSSLARRTLLEKADDMLYAALVAHQLESYGQDKAALVWCSDHQEANRCYNVGRDDFENFVAAGRGE